MLARGKGFISFDMLKELLGLPEDTVIMRAERESDGFAFYVVSKDEVKGKMYKIPENENVRGFMLKEVDIEKYAVSKAIDTLRKQGENHDS